MGLIIIGLGILALGVYFLHIVAVRRRAVRGREDYEPVEAEIVRVEHVVNRVRRADRDSNYDDYDEFSADVPVYRFRFQGAERMFVDEGDALKRKELETCIGQRRTLYVREDGEKLEAFAAGNENKGRLWGVCLVIIGALLGAVGVLSILF